MTYVSITLLALLIIFLVAALWYVDSQLPTSEQDEERARQDMEDMLKRADDEVAKRPHVRAGTNY